MSDSVVIDNQGNIIVQGVKEGIVDSHGNFIFHTLAHMKDATMMKDEAMLKDTTMLKDAPPPSQMLKKPVVGMKKSPSSVFAWPSFVTNAHTVDLMAPFKGVQVRSTDTVRSVLWTLIKNKVECVPVFNDSTKKYVGFVDMFDLVQYIANAAGNSVVKPDFFQIFKRQNFGDTQIAKILSSASKDHGSTVTDAAPLSTLIELTVSANLPQVPVMAKQKVLGMVSQTSLVQFLVKNKANFSELALKTLSDLELSGTDNVYTIEENTPSVTAFTYMAEKGVRGLAIVNKDGQIVDAINSFDINGLVHGDFFSDLRQPVLRYLSKSRILLGRNLAPVVCTANDTLADMLEKMAQENIYRVFVVDSEKKPASVVSLRDILKAIHAFVPSPPAPTPAPTFNPLAGSGGM